MTKVYDRDIPLFIWGQLLWINISFYLEKNDKQLKLQHHLFMGVTPIPFYLLKLNLNIEPSLN